MGLVVTSKKNVNPGTNTVLLIRKMIGFVGDENFPSIALYICMYIFILSVIHLVITWVIFNALDSIGK